MLGKGRQVGLILLLGLLSAPVAEARERARREVTATSEPGVVIVVPGENRALPRSSAMRLGDPRLPPPGYVDYCLRYRQQDGGCR